MEEYMKSSYPPEQDGLKVEYDTSSPISLVEHGLNCIQQGHYTEGEASFALARERLLPDQLPLISALGALNQAVAVYLHSQQVLAEQQAQIGALNKLLVTLMKDMEIASPTRSQPRENLKGYQPLQLQLPIKPPAENSKQHPSSPLEDGNTLPALYITCFSRFEVRRSSPSDLPINLCNNLKGQCILRYLIAQPKYRATMDMLMAVFWPDDEPELANHKLRVAVSALRRSLNGDVISEPGGGYILCTYQAYQFHPSTVLQTDVDEFLALYQAGQQASDREKAMAYYEKACHLYTGPFLTEDFYADWSFIRREELSKTYIVMCDKLAEFNQEMGRYQDATKWASAILKVDRCDEEAHRQLMRAYAAQGRRSEALRQYRYCQRVLNEELGILPASETQNLVHMLLEG